MPKGYKILSTEYEGVYIEVKEATGEEKIFIKYELPADPVTGKRKQKETRYLVDPQNPDPKKKKRLFKNPKEAYKYKNKMEGQVEDGQQVAKIMTLAEVLDFWFEHYIKKKKLQTQVNYTRLIDRIKRDNISRMKMPDLKPYHIESFLNGLLDSIKPQTANNVLTIIRSALEYCQVRELILRNPAKIVEPFPAPRKQKPSPPIEHTVAKLNWLKKMAEENPKDYKHNMMYAFELLDSFTGLRIGEAVALQWLDFEPEGMRIRVSKTALSNVPGQPIQMTTKTDDDSWVHITGDEVKVLLQFKKLCKELLLAQGMHLAQEHFIFLRYTKRGRQTEPFLIPDEPMRTGTVRTWHYQMLEQAGLAKYDVHSNRRGMGALMNENDSTLRSIQDRLRQSDINTAAKHYTEVSDKKRRHEAEKIISYVASHGFRA